MKQTKKHSALEFIFSLFYFLVFHINFWICSLPAWITLILHFVFGLSLWWFWATLAAWLLAGVLRYLMICFGRWGASESEKVPPKENKNPYSQKNRDLFGSNSKK